MNAKAEVITLPDASNVPTVADGLVHMIERLARDPSIDLVRMQTLMEMHERVTARIAAQAYSSAMSEAQAEMLPVSRDASNPQTRSKYASFYALDKAVRPIYTKHGFGLSFDTGKADRDLDVRILCDVSHKGGHTHQHHIDMPADGKGARGGDVMTRTHATMSAVTYGQRGLLKMIFNIAVAERSDDDGNAAAGANAGSITQAQADNLRDLLEASGVPRAPFLKWAKVERIEDIQSKYLESCMNAIKNFQGKKS